jgi:DNA-binding NtrC family response regulator
MQKKSKEMGLREMQIVSDGTLERLVACRWPGNIREQEHAVEGVFILNRRLELRSPVENANFTFL